jgi:hypothetical protein
MTTDDLVERVALAAGCYRACLPERCMCKKIVAIALEEAAKKCEDPCPECAAAIRAMIKD